jgi:hypothetical protein
MSRAVLFTPLALFLVLCAVLSCTQLPQGDYVGTNTVSLTNTAGKTNTIIQTNSVFTNLALTNQITNTTNISNMTVISNTNTVTNSTNIVSYVIVTNTNVLQNAVNPGDFSNFLGEWMVTTDTYLGAVETVDGNGFETEVSEVLTNTSFSLGNGGTNGTIVYRFNTNATVDMFIYDGNGNEVSNYPDYRNFGVYSNTSLTAGDPNSLFVDLVDPTTVNETVYWYPSGTSIPATTTNFYVTSNYTYTNTNITTTTNISSLQVIVTNSWVKYDQVISYVESYVYSLKESSGITNMSWAPNTLTNEAPGKYFSPRRKSYGEVNTTTVADISGNGSVSTITTFQQLPWTTWSMVKITNAN